MTDQQYDPKRHADWLQPHSMAWYAQLGRLTGQYSYAWNASVTEPDGESIFTSEVASMVKGKKMLDIGCGHGEFAKQWSPEADQIVGIDATADFIAQARKAAPPNVTFHVTNTKEKLPFADESFDCAYNRRGPTSAYLDLARVLTKGGQLLALHPGDQKNAPWMALLPSLFADPPAGTPILDTISERLTTGGFKDAEIQTIHNTTYLHEPLDVIRMSLFGQTPALIETAIEQCLPEVTRIFEDHATPQGLPKSSTHYIVRASN